MSHGSSPSSPSQRLINPPHGGTPSLIQAFFAPLHAANWHRTILIAVWMAVLSWLVIPTLLLFGYLAAVIRAVAHNDPIPPGHGWFDQMGDGAIIIGALLLCGLPFTIIAGVLGGTIALASIYGATIGLPRALSSSGLLVATTPMWFALYLLPAVVVRAARTNSATAGLSRQTISAALTKRYATAMTLAVGGASILLPGLLASWIIPVIGPLLWSVPYVIWLAGCSSMFAIATPGTPEEFVHSTHPGTPVPLHDPATSPQPAFSDQYR